MTQFNCNVIGNFKEYSNGGIQRDAKFRQMNQNIYSGKEMVYKYSSERDYNLLKGIEKFHDEGVYLNRITPVLRYIVQESKEKDIHLEEVIQADIICKRAVLKNIACSNLQKPFVIEALKWKNHIYLDCPEMPCNDKDRAENYEGYKNEQYLCLGHDGKKPNYKQPPSTNVDDKLVLRGEISKGDKKIKLFYTAQLDCVDEDGTHCELKATSNSIMSKFWIDNRSLETFMQCYLANIPYVVYSYTHVTYEKGKKLESITKIEKRESSEIPDLSGIEWKLEERLDVLFETLKTIMDRLSRDGMSMRITFDGQKYEYEEQEGILDFVPKEFLQLWD